MIVPGQSGPPRYAGARRPLSHGRKRGFRATAWIQRSRHASGL